MTTEAAERNRPGRKTNAERAARDATITAEGTALTATATDATLTTPDEAQACVTPLEAIQAAMDAVPESQMATWAIEILCKATPATQFRPLFRAAAEQKGEAGVYRLLQVMTKNCHHTHHNQLRMAAAQSAASSRTNGRGIAVSQVLTATELVAKVSYAAKSGCRLQDLHAVAGPLPVERAEC